MRISKVEQNAIGALYQVQHPDGTPVSWSLYWNGPGSRVKLGFNATSPDGMLVNIDAAGCDMPADTLIEATAIVHRFLDL